MCGEPVRRPVLCPPHPREPDTIPKGRGTRPHAQVTTQHIVERARQGHRSSEPLSLVCLVVCRCLREKKQSAIGALRALDSALMNNPANVEKLVELGGLKTIFPVFMVRTHIPQEGGKHQGLS